MSRTFLFALTGAAMSLAPAPSAVAAPVGPEQWCPGQAWDLEWGVNWDRQHCHGTASPQEDDTDLDGDAPPAYGAPPGSDQAPGGGFGADENNDNHADEGSSTSGHDIGGNQSGGKETGN